jgi:hypothetical protein
VLSQFLPAFLARYRQIIVESLGRLERQPRMDRRWRNKLQPLAELLAATLSREGLPGTIIPCMLCAKIAAISMFKLFAKAIRKRRAQRYLADHPDDDGAVGPILFALDRFTPTSAREVAEMRAGHRLSDAQWRQISAQWNRAWNAIR